MTFVSGWRIRLRMPEPPTIVPQPARRASKRATKSPRAQQRAETRERIFETALQEFREYGFAGAQIDRIAKAAGVVRGTFYFHFPTKDDVLIELARRINGRIARRVARLGESKPALRELLVSVNNACMDEHSRVGEAGLLAEMLSLYVRRPAEVNLPPEENVPSLADELTRHLADVRARGGLDTPMSDELVAVVVMTSLFGIYTRLPPGEARREACLGLIDLLARGLEASPTSG